MIVMFSEASNHIKKLNGVYWILLFTPHLYTHIRTLHCIVSSKTLCSGPHDVYP
jgi:hypothetical protein